MPDRLIPAQIRGARGLLDWTLLDLAKAAGVSVSTVKRMEMAEPQCLSAEINLTVVTAFREAGVRFLDDDGEGIGLRFKGQTPPSSVADVALPT